MSDERDLSRADRALVEAIRAEFQPAPVPPARAAQLRRELAERIEAERPSRFRVAVPALAAAALAAALWFALPSGTPTAVNDPSDTSAELDAYTDPDAFASDFADADDYLPA